MCYICLTWIFIYSYEPYALSKLKPKLKFFFYIIISRNSVADESGPTASSGEMHAPMH